ncbi:hydrolase [Streptomyces sp. NBRC 110611]|uniref:hypothetical protein n=1 Tax=Streptomyces sp. NBRC 110611 TaxID=1621259 RepID=UPI00085849E9|nr:hypothetical protein [Streptomyces sp. NBRC 110611]GAU67998.1 hydrolase [Streptomyces sp. NBRC 110611]
MSLAQLRSMNFPALSEAAAEQADGEGRKLSKAQCAHLYALSFTSTVISCGGTPTDYLKMYNQFCK